MWVRCGYVDLNQKKNKIFLVETTVIWNGMFCFVLLALDSLIFCKKIKDEFKHEDTMSVSHLLSSVSFSNIVK